MLRGPSSCLTLHGGLAHGHPHVLPHAQLHVEALGAGGSGALAGGRALLAEVRVALAPGSGAGALAALALALAGAAPKPEGEEESLGWKGTGLLILTLQYRYQTRQLGH